MDIDVLEINTGPSVYYKEDFRNVLESHLLYLKGLNTTVKLQLEPHIVNRFKFDFYGILMNYHIPKHLHWLVLRLNNLYDPCVFPEDISIILVPSESEVDIIRQIYLTKS